MAENLLFNFVEKLIGKLGSLAVESWNVRDDLGKLMDTMSEVKAILLDAEEQQSTNHQVEVWLEKLKDALDDAEDLFDDFSYEELRREVKTRHKKGKKVRIFFSSSNQIVFSFKMARKIKEIGKKLEALNVDSKRFHFTSRTLEQRVKKQRETHSFIPEEVVIGREKEKEDVVEFLLNSNSMNMTQNVSIISIIGFGGLGKTALAQLVYNDEAVRGHFDLRRWVCVSDDFDVKAIAKKIIESQANDEMDRVQQELRKIIEGKRYLFVLDDIWNEDRVLWLQLETLLMVGGKGSKIVITTRSEEVAKISGTSLPFLLKGLDEDQSWKLFTQSAFQNGREPENQNLIAVGKEIVKKCAGVPLAIRSIGSLMYSKESESDWLSISNKDLVKIDEQGNKRVFQILKLSYDHLPFYLKKCFSFCSVFPKDYFISTRRLIRLWVAQGFVEPSDDGRSLEDVGNDYFVSLAHGSFFQDIERDSFSGDVRKCKMHDLMHDLATSVSGKDCVIVNEKEQPDERTRHLSFGFHWKSSWKVPDSFRKASKLRTLLFPWQHIWIDRDALLDESASNAIISRFERLHVLHLCLNSTMLPTRVGMLKHLRYLDLSYNEEIEMLPDSITDLHNLETLLLNGCSKLRELPRDLWKLIALRHLELNWCNKLTCMPRGIEQLTNLQTLSRFVLNTSSRHSAGPSEFSGLNNLRGSLEIQGLECLRSNTAEANHIKLREKSCLEELTLVWDTQGNADDSEVAKDDIILEGLHPHHNIKQLRITGFGGVRLSGWDWVNSLTNLLRICIKDCTRLQTLPPLHLLSQLKVLELLDLSCLEWIAEDGSDDSSSTFFQALKGLYLEALPNLRGWWRCSKEVQGGRCHQFESLDELTIFNCPKLSIMPRYPSVSQVQLEGVSGEILRHAVGHSATAKLEFLYMEKINDLKSMSVLQHLTALRYLEISSCDELDLCNDEDGGNGMQWKELKNLIKLQLKHIPKMEYLPEGLQHVTTLKELKIRDCANLTYLPEWIASLGPSLETFTIRECPKLTSLPEGMRHLTSLQTLRIRECPQLEERCRREVGEDWHKISHVPKFRTD